MAVRFARFVSQWKRRATPDYRPKAAVFLPCKGIDPLLGETIAGLCRQRYGPYRVYCVVESADDPAKEFIETQIERVGAEHAQLVVARISQGRAQKIENLLAALDCAGHWPEVLAFIDSDAVPGPDWLAHLVGPLADPQVGAATGYRWYHPGRTLVGVVRCLWNAAALIYLGDHGRNFCWGGSMALRRETFERLEIRSRWEQALSEDYQVNRAVQEHGLRVAFTPGCVIPSQDQAGWREFWTFARRQLIITRVCVPQLWWLIVVVTVAYAGGFWAGVSALIFGVRSGSASATVAGAGLLMVIYGLTAGKVLARHRALLPLVARPGSVRTASVWDLVAGSLVASFNLALVAASAVSRRFRWRGILYVMDSPLRTRILERSRNLSGTSSPGTKT
jgi:cellulose synthase/poly-beta-1,6-N-acetylglucosamine synthase-like glycosyltransferase